MDEIKNISQESGKSAQREDGRITRERLLECAGRLTAQKGFSLVTSKEICKMAGVNLAAVNYHFGSREGLYREMLLSIHQFLMDGDELKEIAESEKSPKEKISDFIDMVVAQIWSKDSWQMQAWGREVMTLTVSQDVIAVLMKSMSAKRTHVLRIFSEYTGLPVSDSRLYLSLIAFMAPFVMICLGKNNNVEYQKVLNMHISDKMMLETLKQYGFAGLDSFKKK